jgi:hypothetical protein
MNPLWLIVILPAAVFLICLPQLIWPPIGHTFIKGEHKR